MVYCGVLNSYFLTLHPDMGAEGADCRIWNLNVNIIFVADSEAVELTSANKRWSLCHVQVSKGELQTIHRAYSLGVASLFPYRI